MLRWRPKLSASSKMRSAGFIFIWNMAECFTKPSKLSFNQVRWLMVCEATARIKERPTFQETERRHTMPRHELSAASLAADAQKRAEMLMGFRFTEFGPVPVSLEKK